MKHIEITLVWKDDTKSVLSGDWPGAMSLASFDIRNPTPIDKHSPSGQFPRIANGGQFLHWGPVLADIFGAVSNSTIDSGDWIDWGDM